MSRSPASARTEREAREDTQAFLASYRERGGYEGALERRGVARVYEDWEPRPAVGHMPFPGHKHCGEWR